MTPEELMALSPEELVKIVTPDVLIKVIPLWNMQQVMKSVKGIKEVLGLSDMALAAAPAAAPTAAAAAPAAEEQTEFSVFLTGFGEGKKIPVIKIIKTITGTALGDAKKIIEDLVSAPYEVKAGIPKAEADALKKQIEEAGGTVEVK